MVFLDNRHYMPGMERGNAKQDWFAKHPGDKESIVALVAMELLGAKPSALAVPRGSVILGLAALALVLIAASRLPERHDGFGLHRCRR